VEFGEYGLQALEPCWLNAKCIEAGRVTASHFVRGEGRLYIRVFPWKSVSARPPETRMGKGKGEPEFWAAVIRPGNILFELSGVPEETARLAFSRVAHKMPIRCRFVKRRPTL
jgi:large subunit ribosomal protein L16